MKDYITNKSIELGYFENQFGPDVDTFIYTIEGHRATRLVILDLSDHIQWWICVIAWILVFIGTFFRFVLYGHFFEEYDSKPFKPIDKLILVGTVLQHIHFLLVAIHFTLILLNDSQILEYYKSTKICGAVLTFFVFEYPYEFIGGFGLSLYRTLYMRQGDWVKYMIGEHNLTNIILIAGLIIATVPIVAQKGLGFHSLYWNECLLVPQRRHVFELVDPYIQSIGNPSLLSQWMLAHRIVGIILLMLTITELSMYCSFFHNLYKHDNSESLRRLLDPDTIKKRNKRNAVTFFGQFCSFVFEFVTGLSLIIASNYETPIEHKKEELDFWDLLYIIKMFSFTGMAMVEVMTSGVLRRRLLKL